MSAALVGLAAARVSARAGAEPTVVRVASMAPEGTAWARELKAYGRDVEALTGGDAAHQALPRRHRRRRSRGAGAHPQGAARRRNGRRSPASGWRRHCASCACPGMIRRRDEAIYVIDRLRPTVESEFRKRRLRAPRRDLVRLRHPVHQTPVRSMEELRKRKLWIWNLDVVWRARWPTSACRSVPLPVDEAGRAYDEGRVDGLLALPSAALVVSVVGAQPLLHGSADRHDGRLQLRVDGGLRRAADGVAGGAAPGGGQADLPRDRGQRRARGRARREIVREAGRQAAAGERAVPHHLLRRRPRRAREAAARRRAAAARSRRSWAGSATIARRISNSVAARRAAELIARW